MASLSPILVSPTDGELMHILHIKKVRAISHSLPESVGADVLLVSCNGRLGVQRKTLADLLSSLGDGRIAKELPVLARLEFPVLFVEGRMDWTADGHLILAYYTHWTRLQIRNFLRSVALAGISVEITDSINDTAERIVEMQAWWSKPVHSSVYTRPKTSARDTWGNRDVARFVLQGFPGVGSTLAESILERFKRLPLRWDCSLEELAQVKGVGKRSAQKLWNFLGMT